jgi:hypothetical protein
MKTRLKTIALIALAITPLQSVLAGKPLTTIATTPGGSVYLLDRSTIRDLNEGGTATREAIVMTDNRKAAFSEPTAQISSESLFRVHCLKRDYLVVWTRIKQRNGATKQILQASPKRLYKRTATGSFEARIVDSICKV